MDYVFSIQGIPGETIRVTSVDVPGQIDEDNWKTDKSVAIGAVITCESNNVRFTFGGVNPTQGANGLGHILYVGQSIRLSNPASISSFRFINMTNGKAGYLVVTFEFLIGG